MHAILFYKSEELPTVFFTSGDLLGRMAYIQAISWVLLLATMSSYQPFVIGETVGVNYGTNGDNLPNATDVVALYRTCNITKMRIFNPDPAILGAVQASVQTGQPCISISIGTTNADLAPLAGSIDAANQWVQANVVPIGACITYVTAGNEAIPGPDAANIAPAMRNLRAALDAAMFPDVRVSTVVPSSVLGTSYPPSAGAFTAETVDSMTAILTEIASHGDAESQKLMINVYPYFAYASDPADISLEYAQFAATAAVVQDGDLEYWSLFDAMVDGFYTAMEKVGQPTVGLTVSETGWPSDGNGNFTTPDLAGAYARNLWARINNGAGTPKRPTDQIQAYIFAMFNEDLKAAGQEQHFGLFNPDMTPVYPLF